MAGTRPGPLLRRAGTGGCLPSGGLGEFLGQSGAVRAAGLAAARCGVGGEAVPGSAPVRLL